MTKYRKSGTHYPHQFKFYPLERDMGKEDILYIGDVTFQSFDPREKAPDTERTLTFKTSDGTSTVSQIKARDLEYITIPGYEGSLPENSRLAGWQNSHDGRIYFPGESYRLLAGCDVTFMPTVRYSYDFSSIGNAYINGYEDGTFRPQNNITRAEACKIIASLTDPDGKAEGTTVFSDVPSDSWYYKYVIALENIGAFDGIWEDSFEPNEPITRAEFVQIVYAICDAQGRSASILTSTILFLPIFVMMRSCMP